MLLSALRVIGVGPFDDVRFPFTGDDGAPRPVTLIHGGGGVGKTALLTAIANTRPGHCVVWTSPAAIEPERSGPRHVLAEWSVSDEDGERPHPLEVATPSARVFLDEERELLRRREQALFDKLAQRSGFAFLGISALRWFSRQPISISAPARGVARYDVRNAASFDDASRADLARETKQALAYASIGSALAGAAGEGARLRSLGDAMRFASQTLLETAGYSCAGIDPRSLEPLFRDSRGRVLSFDGLPTHARHLAAFAALSVRTLWAACPERDPREVEGVIAIDEVDLHQDPATQTRLISALRRALPRAQWILTTSSSALAASCDAGDVLALRRAPHGDRVELYTGSEARTH